MPIISGLKAMTAWPRHYDEHVAVCTVLEAGMFCAGGRAWKLQSGFRSIGFLSCQGALAIRQVLGHSFQACAQRRHAHARTTQKLRLQGVTWTPACALHPPKVCVPAAKLSHADVASVLCCCALVLWLPSAPRGEQLGLYWPTPLQPQPSWPGRGMACPGEWLSGGGLLLLIQKHEILILLKSGDMVLYFRLHLGVCAGW